MKKNKSLAAPYIRQFYRQNRLCFALAALCCVAMSGVNLLISAIMKELIDAISGLENALSLRLLGGGCLGVLALIAAIELVDYFAHPRFMQRAMRHYKEYALKKLSQKNISSFKQESASTYISALSNDANSIENNLLLNQFTLVSQIVTFVGAFSLMLYYSPLLTLIAALVSLLPVAASMLVGGRMAAAERAVSDRSERLIASLTDCLTGFSVVKSFKAENAILRLLGRSIADAESAKRRRRGVDIIVNTIGSVAGAAAQFGVFLAGTYLALSGHGVTAGTVIAFVQLMNFVIQPIAMVPGILANRKAARTLIEKLAAALEDNVRDEGEPIPARLDDAIDVRDVTFCYDGAAPALDRVSVRFEAGKSYAVVGASGSGKSTLLNLLTAAHDDYQGSIFLDGHELRGVSTQSLYDLMSIIQQNVFVFNASIRDNITMFADFPKAQVDRAIKLSGLSSLIAARGEDMLCGENGSALSGGEKQRIAIARSLLRRSSVLLADEATAALDARTAAQVTDAILSLTGLTRIVVTHSLIESQLARYDEIIVLKSGRIAEQGRFDELMEKKGYFYSLFTVSQ